MIDIHCHILHGVDDGALTLQDSLKLIKHEIDNGVNSIIMTPHFNKNGEENDMYKVIYNFEELKEIIMLEKLNVKLYLGNEIFLKSDFYDVLEKNNFQTLAGSNYILVEFYELSSLKNVAEMCYAAVYLGYIPIIAHAERYYRLFDSLKMIEYVLNEGALLQINASSITNKKIKYHYKLAHLLIKHKYVSFVASDIHNINLEQSCLIDAYKIIKRKCGICYADKIFYENQLKIINNELI